MIDRSGTCETFLFMVGCVHVQLFHLSKDFHFSSNQASDTTAGLAYQRPSSFDGTGTYIKQGSHFKINKRSRVQFDVRRYILHFGNISGFIRGSVARA